MADNVEMQGIEFQIVNDSSTAVQGIDALRNALNRLKTATGSSTNGLGNTARSIRELSNALKGLNSGDASQKITRLANALTTLSRVGNVKISSSIANQLTALNTALADLKWTDGDKLTALADGLRPLSELGRANMTSFINQLEKLPAVIAELDKADLDKFADQLNRLAAAMKPFADEMQSISNGFSAFPSRIQRLITSTNRYNTAVSSATTRTNAWGTALKGIKISSIWFATKRLGSAVAEYVYDASEWEGIMYRFGRAMGESAQENYEWIKRLNSEMKINVQQFMQYSSIYGTMLKGFGVSSEDAAKMAMGYTELTYDIWAGYNDIYKTFEDAAVAVRSAIAGEVEPIRRAGMTIVDSQLKATAANVKLSTSTEELQTRWEKLDKVWASSTNDTLLETTAATYGLKYSSQSASEELKSYLRYLTMVDQAKAQDLIGTYSKEMNTAEGLIRTLRQQVTSLSQAFGSLLLPALVKVLPYVQAFVELIGEAIATLAMLFGIELQPVDFSSSLNAGASAAEDMADGLSDAAGAAKKLQQYTLGFDELNIIDPTSGSGSSSGGASAGGSYDGMFDIDKVWNEEIFKNINSQVDELKEKLKDALVVAAAIGTAFLTWKIAKGVVDTLEILKGLKGQKVSYGLTFAITGLGLFLDAWDKIKTAVQDILNNGANFTNVTRLISGFAEGLGMAFAALGKTKWSGAMLYISGLSGIMSAISDMVENGVNWDNATDLIRNLGIFLSGIGVLTNHPTLTGGGLMLTGITLIIRNLQDILDAFRTGDWSGVDKVEVAAGVALTIGGAITAFRKVKDVIDTTGGSKSIADTSTAMQGVSDAVGGSSGGGLNGSMKTLAQNLGWGVLVVAEVSAAAIIIVGAIWVLGEELKKVGEAWQPVIDNAGTVAIAIGVGTGLLVAVGLAAYALGTLGKTAAVNIGIGTLILLELGVAAGLFIAEIWAVGRGLDEVRKAWQPVLDDADTVKTAILTGTGLLLAVGAVAAALGVATIATGALLPAAILIGAGVLAELAGNFIIFVKDLVAVSDELSDNLSPALRKLNDKLPDLKDDMSDFTDYMGDFADEVSSYTESMGRVTWNSIVSGFQKIFSGNPIGDLADDVNDIYTDVSDLNSKLALANPELTSAVELMSTYVDLMGQLQQLSKDGQGAGTLSGDVFTNLRTVGENLITGLVDGITSKMPNFNSKMVEIQAGITNTFELSATRACNSIQRIIDQLRKIPTTVNTSINLRQYGASAAGIRAYASGGFVDQGELFIAREAGAEMVGSIGRRTAVANNDQIVDGIEDGVYRAMMAAFATSNRSGVGNSNDNQPISVQVFLDSKEITSSVEKRQRERGTSILGGVVYG